jgi:stage II sporulation protein D
VLAVGTVVDLEVTRRGVSGRAAELTVRGSRGRATLRGFDIRTTLGLMETLFTIERLRDRDGDVRTFVFAGKGWGHGVGLCQVGAFGMAVRGRTSEQILRHYYSGIELVSLADRPDLMASPFAAP